MSRTHGARDGSTDGCHTLGLGDVRGNAVQRWRAVPENGIDVSDPGSNNGPSLGTSVSNTALSFVSVGIVLLHGTVRVEHFKWRILC